MDKTLLPSLGIVAGIMTLAYYVGGSKEVRWADTTTPTKKPTYADCDCGIPTDAIGDPTCEECFVCQCNKAKCDVVSSYDSAYCVYCQIAADCKGCDCQCAMCNKYVPLKDGDHPQGNTGDRHLFWCNMCGENLCGGCYGDDDGRYCEYHVGKGRAEQDGYSRYTAESFSAEPSTKIPGYAALPFKGFRVAYEHDDEIIKYYDNLREIVSDFNEGHILDTDTGYLRIEFRPVKKLGAETETFESPVSCNICGKTFDSFRGLNGHMNAHIPAHRRKRAESLTSAAVTTRSLGSAEKYECPTCKIVWYDTHTDHDFDTAGNPLCPLCAHAGYVSDAESFAAEGLFCPSCKDNTRMDESEEWCHLCEASYGAESFATETRFIPVQVMEVTEWFKDRFGYYPDFSRQEGSKYHSGYAVVVRGQMVDKYDTKEEADQAADAIRIAIGFLGGMTPDDGTHPRAEREMIAESFGAEENEMCPSCDKAKIGQDHNRYLVCPLCDWRSDEQVPCRHLNIEITDTDYAGEYEGGVIVYASCEDCGADLQAFGVWEE